MRSWGVLCAAMALVSAPPAMAQDISGAAEPPRPSRWAGAEIGLGMLAHGANFHPLGSQLTFPRAPAGYIYEGQEEDDTVDVQLTFRTRPLPFHWALRPRLTAKAQLSTGGRTDFFSLGAEWRQHILRGRGYGQIGIGVTLQDGYRFTPDPFAPGLGADEARRRYAIYSTRVGFGSQVLFNPNASLGVRLDRRWAAEVTWEHFSHRQIFSQQNPGIDNVGIRLVRTLGPRR